MSRGKCMSRLTSTWYISGSISVIIGVCGGFLGLFYMLEIPQCNDLGSLLPIDVVIESTNNYQWQSLFNDFNELRSRKDQCYSLISV